MLDKLERKFGRFAIPGLIRYLIAGYIAGYVMSFLTPGALSFLSLEPYMIIHKFQLWRLISWVLIPPAGFGLFTIIMLMFYWSLGSNLEQMWGTFRFNLYIFGGIFFTVIGSFIVYFVVMSAEAVNPMWGIELARDSISGALYPSMGRYFSTYYINMSIFLAFALTIPDMQVLLYFIIPIKMKWLAILYAALVGVDFFNGSTITKISIICSLANFLIFFLSTRNFKTFNRRASSYGGGYGGYGGYNRSGGSSRGTQRSRSFTWRSFGGNGGRDNGQEAGSNNSRQDYDPYSAARAARQNAENANKSGQISRHRCAICGRTEISNPGLEFRFCSKCNGNYEYCNEHLFTHEHVK